MEACKSDVRGRPLWQIRSHIMAALESYNLISSFQFGFCYKHSTVDLLMRTIYDMALSLENRSSVHCLLLDFSKAFDSVPLERLLLKLDAIGIRGHLLQWIRCFLTIRLQRVVINGKFFHDYQYSQGYPKGLFLSLHYLSYMLMTFTQLFVILIMACLQMICQYTRMCQHQLTVPCCSRILIASLTGVGVGSFS